jgi:hypothetical protein
MRRQWSYLRALSCMFPVWDVPLCRSVSPDTSLFRSVTRVVQGRSQEEHLYRPECNEPCDQMPQESNVESPFPVHTGAGTLAYVSSAGAVRVGFRV